MRSPRPHAAAPGPFNVDLQLVAAVQTHAGARCHEAGTLLNCYTLWAELNQQAVRTHNVRDERASRTILEKTEVDLRRLLFQCRWPRGVGALR
jgi:hypothetical protein